MKITVVLHNIRSTYNVGAILRSMEGFGITQAVFSGYTPRYDDPESLPHLRAKLNHQIAKSALGAEKLVKILVIDDIEDWLTQARKTQAIVGLENNLDTNELKRRYFLGDRKFWQAAGERDLVLILGEEVHGLPPTVRQYVDFFLEIPMSGQKESFNVSVATGIALWALSEWAVVSPDKN